MTSEKIKQSIIEAERFLARAKTLLKILKEKEIKNHYIHTCENPIERGALRRSSLDLTRSLSELRK